MTDDGRYVKTPYGKMRTEAWLRQQLERQRRREAAVARFGRQIDDGRPPQPARARPGPPAGSGLTAPRIVNALVEWRGEWPPTQAALAEDAFGGASRTIRDALHKAGTNWEAVVAEAAGKRR